MSCASAYPTLQLVSDPNDFRISALTYNTGMNPYSYDCQSCPTTNVCPGSYNKPGCSSDDPNNYAVPAGFQFIGQRRACCQNNSQKVPNPSLRLFPGASLNQQKRGQVDDLSKHFTNYARNAIYVGNFGGMELQ